MRNGACVLIVVLGISSAAWAGNRPDIYSFTPTQRTQLKTLMDGYIDKVTAGEHCNTHGIHGSLIFFPWHRGYVRRMEDYLATHGGSQFVPLPKWDPSTTIPAPFDTFVDADCSSYTCMFGDGTCDPPFDTTPEVVIPQQFASNLCSNTVFSQFSTNLEQQFHNGVHGAIGGVLKNYRGPSAPIFWLWHAYVDDIWYQWECSCGLGEGSDVQDETNLASGADLWMKDSDEDLGYEPNSETGSNLWSSEDIWVRNVRDTQVATTPARFASEHDHQNPEYAANPSNAPWIYVKTRNRGCAAVSGDLHVYWANASTGLDWDSQWNEVPGSPIHISSLPSAGTGVAEIQWTDIPMPTPTAGSHFCLLTRFVGDAGTPDPIVGEIFTPNVGINVRNSNNIAWKNLIVVDDVVNKTGGFIVRNNGGADGLARMDIMMPAASKGGNYLGIGTLRAALSPSLFSIWDAGGRQGTGFVVDPNSNELIVQSTSASIRGLALPVGTDQFMTMKFDQTIGPCESDSTEFRVELSEVLGAATSAAMPSPTPTLPTGGMTYNFRTNAFRRSSPGVETSYPKLVECSTGSIPITAVVPEPLPVGLTVASYQWALDGVPIAGATQSSVLATQSGAWTVRVGYNNGCFSTSPPHPFFVGGPPSNDSACSASSLVLGSPVSFANHCATPQPGEVRPGVGVAGSGCAGNDGWCREDPNVQNSIWFTFVAPGSGAVTFEGDHADVQLAVWNVSNCASFAGGFAKVGANDDGLVKGPWGTSPALSLSGLVPDKTYYLQVDGFRGIQSDAELLVSSRSSSTTAIPAISGWGFVTLAAAISLMGSALIFIRTWRGGT